METWNLLISKRIRPKRLSFNKLIMVGAEGFEPPTLCSQSRCATRLRYAPMDLFRTSFIVARRELETLGVGRRTVPIGSWAEVYRALFWIRLGGAQRAFGRGTETAAAVEPGQGEGETV